MTSAHDTVVEPPIDVDIALRTDPGRDPEKQVNEDSGFTKVTRFGTLLVVCDGMGGHANGQEASRAAVAAIEETFDGAPDGSVGRDLLRVGITLGHDRVRALPSRSGEARAGSTVVAVLVTPHGAEVAHVGDSRVYFVSRGTVAQVTRDHSMVQLMVEAGMLKPEEAATHPDANKIMRALGIAPTVEVDLRPEPLTFGPGDCFVLASDGLTDLVTEAEILHMVGTLPPEQAAGQMVDLANARGGHDNITVVVARMREGSHAHAPKASSSKTVPVTALDPIDVSRASPATVLAAPLPIALPNVQQGSAPATALAPPLAVSGPAVVPPVPSAPRAQPSEPPAAEARGLSAGLVVAVVVVALAVLGGVGYAIYGQLQRTKHKDPTIIVPLGALGDAGSAAQAPDPDPEPTGSEPPPETPPLAVPPPTKPQGTHTPPSPRRE